MQQELIPLGADVKAVSTVSGAFTPPLKDLLRSAVDAKEAAKLVRSLPWALEECRRMNETAQRLMAPMGAEAVYVALQPCLILYGSPDLSHIGGDLTAAWISIYQKALQGLPKESLEYAVSDYIANAKKPFFPKPSELNAIAIKHAAAIGQLAWRCKVAVEAADAAESRVESDEDRARGEALVRETLEALRSGGGLSAFPRPPVQTRSRAEVAEELRRAGA